MVRTLWGLLVGAALAAPAPAQEPATKVRDWVPPTEPATVTTLPHPQFPDLPGLPGGPPACAPFEDCNGPLLKGDPLLDGHCGPTPGWFTALDVGILKPHIHGVLTGSLVVANTFTDTIALANASLDWTASPHVEVGYRFAGACGEVILSYRALATEGDSTLLNFDVFGAAHQRSRLNLNVIDLDYGENECSLGPCASMKWRIGVRLASEYYDTRAAGPVLEERSSNHFLGAGPHACLELTRKLGDHGLALYGRFEGGALLGQISQSFEEVLTAAGQGQFGGASKVSQTQGVPIVELEAGFAWTPWPERPLHLMAGYQVGSWWYVGDTNNGSRSDLSVQGVFLRGEWGY